MKRLVRFDIGGIPYVNTDFTDILQTEHLKCYSGLLDGMNQSSFTGRNSGIVLKGCNIEAYSFGGYFMNFYDSMIYLNGEFYTYNSTSSQTVNITNDTFYLYAMATMSESRYLRDLTSTASVVESAYFTWSISEPASGQYIKFSSGGSSRYFKRILKYFTSRSGDIYISSSKEFFSATGLGFNDMEGFVMLNDKHKNIGPDYSGKFLRVFPNRPQDASYGYGLFNEYGSATVSLDLGTTPRHIHPSSGTTYSMKHSHSLNTAFNNAYYLQNVRNSNSPNYIIDDTEDSEGGYSDSDLEVKDGWPTISHTQTGGGGGGSLASTTFLRAMEQEAVNGANINNITNNGEPTNTNDGGRVWQFMFTEGVAHKSRVDLDATQRSNRLDFLNNNYATHSHTFSRGQVGIGNIGDPAAPHDNRPNYRVVVYYTKKYDFTWRD
jgi:hypothetical protein